MTDKKMKSLDLKAVKRLLEKALPGLTLDERLEYLAKRTYGADTYKKNHRRICERFNNDKMPMNIQGRAVAQFSAALEAICRFSGYPFIETDYLKDLEPNARCFRQPVEDNAGKENDDIGVLTTAIIAASGKREEQLERIARLIVQQNEKIDQVIDILCRLLKAWAGGAEK